MIRLAGKDGFALVSAFNGNDLAFAAPKIYHPMKSMVKRIDMTLLMRRDWHLKTVLGTIVSGLQKIN